MSVLLLLLQIKLKVAQYAYKYSEELKTIFSEVSGWRSGYLLTSRCADTGSISRVGLAVRWSRGHQQVRQLGALDVPQSPPTQRTRM